MSWQIKMYIHKYSVPGSVPASLLNEFRHFTYANEVHTLSSTFKHNF